MLPNSLRRIVISILVISAMSALPAIGQITYDDMKLINPDATENDWFGYSIAQDNGILAVGAPGSVRIEIPYGPGSVYLFDATTGDLLFRLTASDGEDKDWFGNSVAISNGIVAVGAMGDDDNGNRSGSAYLFDALTGEQLFKLLPTGGADIEQFGSAIAIENNTVLVGSSNDSPFGRYAGTVFVFNATTGEQIRRIIPENDGGTNNDFGHSVDVHNGIAVVGDRYYDISSVLFDVGSVRIINVATGEQLFKLVSIDALSNDYFGISVAIDDGIVVVGCPGHINQNPGAAYVYDATTGALLHKLVDKHAGEDYEFGSSVDIKNGLIVVGSKTDGEIAPLGSAFVFNAKTGEQIAKLLPSDSDVFDWFGYSALIDSAGKIVVGAHLNSNGSNQSSGAAYTFTTPNLCSADFNGDFQYNFFDVSLFVTAYSNNDPIADFDDNGMFNFFDIAGFLAVFNAGCP